MRRVLLVVLVGLYLQQHTDVQMRVLEVISKLVKRTSSLVSCEYNVYLSLSMSAIFFQCPEALVFVQYILSQRENREPVVSLRLLNLLPDLAAHKVYNMLPHCQHTFSWQYDY